MNLSLIPPVERAAGEPLGHSRLEVGVRDTTTGEGVLGAARFERVQENQSPG